MGFRSAGLLIKVPWGLIRRLLFPLRDETPGSMHRQGDCCVFCIFPVNDGAHIPSATVIRLNGLLCGNAFLFF